MDVKIVEMGEMRVASFHAYGEHPEAEAVKKMQEWAKPRGLISEARYPVFGFDNPSPKPGDAKHGYDVWVVLDEKTDTKGAEVKSVPAAKYAKTRSEGLENIGPNWRRLVEWAKENGHKWGGGQCLEGHVFGSSEGGHFALDLYYPIK